MNNSQLITNIKSVCKRQSIPFSEMLERCGLSKGFMYDVEKRDRSPSIDKITAIAEFLGVSVDYLLGRTDEPCRTVSNSVVNEQHNVSIGGDNVQSISGTISQRDRELLDKINSLNFDDYADIISYINAKVKSAGQK